MSNIKINTIPEALEDLRNGKVIIVVDDENRENEGDFIAAASTITSETVNFMTMYGRGLVCTSLTQKRAEELDLNFMVGHNTDPKQTAFTVSIDLLGQGVTTGISASDRAKTIFAMTDERTKPKDFARPGHIFPLIAKEGGVLKRDGHTEATVDLMKLAGLPEVGVLVEVMKEDGTMARLPQLAEVAEKFNLKLISIKDLIAYRLQNDSLVEKVDDSFLNTYYGEFRFVTFKDKTNGQTHFALVKGDFKINEVIPVRVKAINTYLDLFRDLAEGEEKVMDKIMQHINKEGKGILVFINNPYEGSVINLHLEELKEYVEGKISKPLSGMNERNLGIGAQIIKELGVTKIKVITRHTGKKYLLSSGYGIEIMEEIKI